MSGALIDLAAARAKARQGRCVCGCGVFTKKNGAMLCHDCGRARPLPSDEAAQLAVRCGCGSALFLVTLEGLECRACRHATRFDDIWSSALLNRFGRSWKP